MRWRESPPGAAGRVAARPGAHMGFLRDLLRDQAGLWLGADKGYLVEARLGAVAGRHGLPDAGALIDRLQDLREPALRDEAVEAMTIRETSFLRDVRPFRAFGRTILPALLRPRRPNGPIAVWSAGCSTGQEPYSLAMTVREHEPAAARDGSVMIVASDISREAVERARAGRYSQIEVNRGLPATWLVRWFDRAGTRWIVRDEIRDMVRCFTSNLIRPESPLPRFDVIFARYVLMYLHPEVRREVVAMLQRSLTPGGILVIGATETLWGMDEGLERIRLDDTTCYRRKGD